eukprot:358462-Chlamydomonas_euryale.AAC.3
MGKPNKHRTELTPQNIFGKAAIFAEVRLRGVVALAVLDVVGMMLKSGKYILSKAWAFPNAHMNQLLCEAVWKSRTNLRKFTGVDLSRVLFGGGMYTDHVDELPIIDRDYEASGAMHVHGEPSELNLGANGFGRATTPTSHASTIPRERSTYPLHMCLVGDPICKAAFGDGGHHQRRKGEFQTLRLR